MPEITAGRVVYSRVVQPAPFESRHVEAELSFVVAAGEDPARALAEVGELVRGGVLELVGARGEEETPPSRGSPESEGAPRSSRRFNRRSDHPDYEIPL